MDDAIRRRLHEQAINASEKVRKASADYQDWLDLAERKLRKKDERIAELEAENKALRLFAESMKARYSLSPWIIREADAALQPP